MLNIIMDYRMVPPLSVLSLALYHEALEGGGNQSMGTIKYAKRNFPNAKKLEPATGNQQMGTIFPPQCSSGPILPFFGFQKLYTIYGAKPIYAPENLDSFASLTLYARFARYPNSLPT